MDRARFKKQLPRPATAAAEAALALASVNGEGRRSVELRFPPLHCNAKSTRFTAIPGEEKSV